MSSMHDTSSILITGGNGFLGRRLVQYLLDHTSAQLYLLVRSKTIDLGDFPFQESERLHLLRGDLTRTHLFDQTAENEALAQLALKQVTTIVHLAAYYDLQGDDHAAYLNNVVATQNLLYFANQMPQLTFFHFCSSVAVSGDHWGVFYEDELECHQHFSNNYAETKYGAEVLVRHFVLPEQVQKRIYRPGVIVGDSMTGEISKVDGPYYFLKFLQKFSKMKIIKKIPSWPFPYSRSALLPMIPVDEAARAMGEMIISPVVGQAPHDGCRERGDFSNDEDYKTRSYHLFSSPVLTVEEFMQESLRSFGLSTVLIALPAGQHNRHLLTALKLPKELMTYLYNECEYDQANLYKDFPQLQLKSFADYKEALFRYMRGKE